MIRTRSTVCAVILLAGCSAGSKAVGPSEALGSFAYVTNEDSGDISVVDLDREAVVFTIPVGKRPRGIRIRSDTPWIFAAVSGSPKASPGQEAPDASAVDRQSDGIAVIDATTRRLVRILESGPDPESFDLSSDGQLLFVSNEDAATASIVNVTSGAVLSRVEVGSEPEGVRTRPDGQVVYIACETSNRIDVIDSRSGLRIAQIPVGARPRSVTFSRDGEKAWVANENAAALTVIDARGHKVLGSIALTEPNARPMGTALSADGRWLYVTLGRARALAVIDTARGEVVHVVREVGARPWGVAASRDGRIFTANGPSNDVSVIDGLTWAVRKIPVGRSPWGIALRE
jgi:YVTN family beta-propeller protein